MAKGGAVYGRPEGRSEGGINPRAAASHHRWGCPSVTSAAGRKAGLSLHGDAKLHTFM